MQKAYIHCHQILAQAGADLKRSNPCLGPEEIWAKTLSSWPTIIIGGARGGACSLIIAIFLARKDPDYLVTQ